MDFEAFTNKTKEAFSFLNVKYGFSRPEVENLGREIYVYFHRNEESVSISLEAGSEPIIELFLLCEGTTEKALSWAARNGKKRFRKFPKLAIEGDFFVSAPRELERVEREWLKT
ncbi:MAG: hypothetical protein KME56_18980 [Candidatus Thiodiazotropha sp. (ex Ctena orbiculata)]|nr:hypothetical protein [Candidatus Thiodiazotropha taylori]MBT2998697.1 hypothetical protein [Candidatus Thiodiazotropha taylori]MBT3002811.1 hypothetical protein [Candidatus Thiodiazotropha taylori]MBV2108739.1 hypothetical protein [Candidatus Thiodiazotropha taylori]MBV2113149.1 hypothetical protein [Candidatus Thiodiazotropha taylori]